jgi:hypothetical protein
VRLRWAGTWAPWGDLDHQKAGQISRFVYDRGNKILEKSTTGVTNFCGLTPKCTPRCLGVRRLGPGESGDGGGGAGLPWVRWITEKGEHFQGGVHDG